MTNPGPAHDLSDARRRMRWEVAEGELCLAGFPEPPAPADLELAAEGPFQVVREGGETTLLVRVEHLPAILARHPQARVQRGLAWIRFELAMEWELVGFLALVTGALAEAGVPLGAVCGYSRDHLFVERSYLECARAVLSALFPAGAPPP